MYIVRYTSLCRYITSRSSIERRRHPLDHGRVGERVIDRAEGVEEAGYMLYWLDKYVPFYSRNAIIKKAS